MTDIVENEAESLRLTVDRLHARLAEVERDVVTWREHAMAAWPERDAALARVASLERELATYNGHSAKVIDDRFEAYRLRVASLEATIREVGACAGLLEQMSGIFAKARAALAAPDAAKESK